MFLVGIQGGIIFHTLKNALIPQLFVSAVSAKRKFTNFSERVQHDKSHVCWLTSDNTHAQEISTEAWDHSMLPMNKAGNQNLGSEAKGTWMHHFWIYSKIKPSLIRIMSLKFNPNVMRKSSHDKITWLVHVVIQYVAQGN